MGGFGILVAAVTFLPVLLKTTAWYLMVHLASLAGDLLGTRQLSTVLRACASVLGLLIAIVFCFALLVIISTSIMLVMGGT